MLSRVVLTAIVFLSPADAGSKASTTLLEAIRAGSGAAVARALGAGASANLKDADGTPALMLATLFADARCMKVLLDGGADPNATDAFGATALIWAQPNVEKARLLIRYGADVNTRPRSRGLSLCSLQRAIPGQRTPSSYS